MLKEEHEKYAIPMVAIYLLGHCVGKIEEPVIYVNHHAYNYDGKKVEEGIPDPFVESLQHDSIIVQIPLLHGRVNNRLEKVLCLFDQTNVADNKKVIKVDDKQFEGDNDMEYIVRRLQSAAADPDMRYQMNAEDEFFKVLEEKDTQIMQLNALLEKDGQLKEKDEMLRKMIKGMLENGMSLDAIAGMLNKTVDEVKQIM